MHNHNHEPRKGIMTPMRRESVCRYKGIMKARRSVRVFVSICVKNVVSWASCLAEDEFSGADSTTILLHFNADQSGLPVQPIDSPNSTFPTTSHLGASLLVRPCDLPLGAASMTESIPLLWRNSRRKCRMQCAEKVEIGDIWGAPTFYRRTETGAGTRVGSDNDGPREFMRAKYDTG